MTICSGNGRGCRQSLSTILGGVDRSVCHSDESWTMMEKLLSFGLTRAAIPFDARKNNA